jgi:3-deoxy-D-manno-octulosonate 8-phosphate phosphatase (KDO 8-P phosphatase)
MKAHHHEVTWLQSVIAQDHVSARLKKVRLLACDVDGSLTSGSTWLSADGQEMRDFSIVDGYGMVMFRELGHEIALITGSRSGIIKQRAERLGIPLAQCHTNALHTKAAVLEQIQRDLKITKDETLIFGDDIPDLPLISCAALFAVPCNAVFYVRSRADLEIPLPGGAGALRLLIDAILYIQGQHPLSSTINALVC